MDEMMESLLKTANENGIDCLASLEIHLPHLLREKDVMERKIEEAIGCLLCAGISSPLEVCLNTLSILQHTPEHKLGELNES